MRGAPRVLDGQSTYHLSVRRFAGSLTETRNTGEGRILAVRGRRVGKSTAVTAFVEQADTPHGYFTGVKLAPVHRQLEALAEAFLGSRRPVADVHLLFDTPPRTWREVFNRWALAARNAPVIVVLDEFPWAVEADPSLEGELQVAWDTTLSKLPILLIMIGSDVAMMSRLLEHDRPLFGRVTPILVPALNPAEVAQALPGRTALEIFDAYLVTGGYPRLVQRCAAAKTTAAYVETALTDPYLRFWFRFIARHLQDISRSRGDIAVTAYEATWSSWRGRAIEPHVNEALTRLGATHPELTGVQRAGAWWTRDNSLEVDIVARTADSIATVGTIKWRPRGGVTRTEMAELAGARNVIPHAGGARLLAVCPSGLAPGASADIVLRPADLLAAWGA